MANCNLTLIYGAFYGTNAHTHDSPLGPSSIPSPTQGVTNAYGYFPVTLTTTIVGQAEFIESCPSPAGSCYLFQYAVGVSDIYWVSDHGIWIQNGAKPYHGDSVNYNHWMTSHAAYGIYYTTLEYQSVYPGLVYSNDMALPYGGIFDINATWMAPHMSHDFGTAADIDLIPQANVSTFLTDCQNNGAVDYREESNGSLHCRWGY